MQKKISLSLLPSEAANDDSIRQYIARTESVNLSDITGFTIIKQSIDARSKQAWINLTLLAYINEPYHQRKLMLFNFQNVAAVKKKVIIVGAGPAGLFAALKLIE